MVRNSALVARHTAINAHDAVRAGRAAVRGGGRAAAFDAAGASGLTYLQAQLELVGTDLVKPLQAVTHPRDITIKTGGGFPEFISEWASNYGSTGSGTYGLQGTNNTEIPQAQVDVAKQTWPTYIWAAGFTITWVDLQRMHTAQRTGQPAPFSLQTLYDEAVATIWAKALDYVTYNGFLGGFGLVNNPNVPAFVVPSGGSGSAWATKTPSQILDDVNAAINLTVINSGYDVQNGCANSLLLPYTQFATLTRPMTIGGVGYDSTISYIEKHCVAAAYGVKFKIFPLPNDWISGKGLAGTDRGVCYRNDEKSLLLRVPTPCQKAMTVPTTRAGGAYETMFAGNVSSVIFKRTTTQVYMDGI